MLFARWDLRKIIFYFIDVRENFIIYDKYSLKIERQSNFFLLRNLIESKVKLSSGII